MRIIGKREKGNKLTKREYMMWGHDIIKNRNQLIFTACLKKQKDESYIFSFVVKKAKPHVNITSPNGTLSH